MTRFMKILSFAIIFGILLIMATPFPGFTTPPLHLTAPRNFITGDIPSLIIPMDMDNDGDRDVAILSASLLSNPQLQLFENQGNGILALHSSIDLPAATEIVSGDLNGDNRLDLAQVHTVDIIHGELITLVQNGSFSFTKQTLSLPFPCSHLCVGNLDRTNGLDLVIGDDLDIPQVYVYLANGTGSYTMHGIYNTEQRDRDVNGDGWEDRNEPVTIQHCLCADLNGDGNDDLVVSNIMNRNQSHKTGEDVEYTLYHKIPNIVVLLNQGGGGFGPFQILLDPFGKKLGVADMDGDGDKDIVTTGTSLSGPDRDDLILIANNGDGTFLPPVRFPSGGGEDSADDLELADVDGDGNIDAGIILFGPVSGNNNDHLTDHWALLKNNGNGNLGIPEIYPAGADILDLEFSDLNGDSRPEALTVAGDDNRFSVHYNENGRYPVSPMISIDDPRYPKFGNTPVDIASGDFNGDGLTDLAVITTISQLLQDGPDTLVLLNGIKGGISSIPSIVDLPEGPSGIILDQMAGSSADDIGIIYTGSSISGAPMGVGLNLGVNGGMPGPVRFASLNGLSSDIAAFNINSDGTCNLAVLRNREGFTAGISIFSVGNDGVLTYWGDLILGSDNVLDFDVRFAYVMTSVDMNGDKRKDLIAVTRNMGGTNGIISVIINNGDLNFTLVGEYQTVSREVTDITGADVTGDGLADILLTTAAGLLDAERDGSLEVIPNMGNGRLGNGTSYNTGMGPVSVAAAQMDNIAGLDIVVSNDGSNEITVLFNDGTGGFQHQERYLTNGGCDGITLADFDQDGDQDVAVCNDENMLDNHHGTVTLLFNRTNSQSIPGDLNNDGKAGLDDAIMALKILTKMEKTSAFPKGADVNGDKVIGLPEISYILQKVSGLR